MKKRTKIGVVEAIKNILIVIEVFLIMDLIIRIIGYLIFGSLLGGG